MKIKSANIRFFKKSGFDSVCNENVKNVKILPCLSIVQSVEGSYDITLGNGEKKQTGEGGFFIAPSGVQQTIVHHVSQSSKKMSARWIFLEVEINKMFSLDALYRFPVVVNDEQRDELNRLFDCLFASDNVWENYSDCYRLLKHLIQMATPIQAEPRTSIQSAVAYMTEHYTERITVETLSNIAAMSTSNFYAAFKKNMGCSPIVYLNHYRLSIAADLLINTDQSVSAISYSVGINDVLYFSKLFKKAYGTPPKEYRSIYKR